METKIKGTRNGFILTFDKGTPLKKKLKNEIKELFNSMGQMLDNQTIFITPESLEKDNSFDALSVYIKSNFNIKDVKLKPIQANPIGDIIDKTINPLPQKSADKKMTKENETLLHSGRVRSGQKIYSTKHIVILGDVNPGGVVVAGGDIIILGSLLGNAIAGQSGNLESIIVALEFNPVQIQISTVIAAGVSGLRSNNFEYACVQNGAIVVLDYKKENPFSKLPRLIER